MTDVEHTNPAGTDAEQEGCTAECAGCPDCKLECRCDECGEAVDAADLCQHPFGGEDVCIPCGASLKRERFAGDDADEYVDEQAVA